jgi:hypothetical protein
MSDEYGTRQVFHGRYTVWHHDRFIGEAWTKAGGNFLIWRDRRRRRREEPRLAEEMLKRRFPRA